MTSSALVPVHRFRTKVPREHQGSLDTRLAWLWNQRFGTVQTIWKASQGPGGDVLDHTACTLILQAIMAKDLDSIAQLFHRIEGGALNDHDLIEKEGPLPI